MVAAYSRWEIYSTLEAFRVKNPFLHTAWRILHHELVMMKQQHILIDFICNQTNLIPGGYLTRQIHSWQLAHPNFRRTRRWSLISELPHWSLISLDKYIWADNVMPSFHVMNPPDFRDQSARYHLNFDLMGNISNFRAKFNAMVFQLEHTDYSIGRVSIMREFNVDSWYISLWK